MLNNRECTLCGACVQICPKGCITLQKDGPRVDLSACVDCHLCEKHCHLLQMPPLKQIRKAWYAAASDSRCRGQSASGGGFAALAASFLEAGGVVYGSAWSREQWRAEHIRVDRPEELSRLQGSKYVQSLTGNTYTQVREDLKDHRRVLYSGTPCQIAGLYQFLGKNPQGLITVDIVCHGVPESDLFRDYVDYYEKKHGVKTENWVFRRHEKDQQEYYGEISLAKGSCRKTVPLLWTSDPYYFMFMYGVTSRKTCYTCRYAQRMRVGDITAGDFWGIEDVLPGVKAGNISLLLANSQEGQRLIEQCAGLDIGEVDIELACRHNGQLNAPTPEPVDAARRFWSAYTEGGWAAVEGYFLPRFRLQRIKGRISFYCPGRLKKIIRRLLRK